MVSHVPLKILATIAIIFIAIFVYIQLGNVVSTFETPPFWPVSKESNASAKPTQPVFRARKNIWAGITQVEAEEVLRWIHDDSRALNLTAVEDAGPKDNSVWLIELLQPNKTDSISFLDLGEQPPRRFARVTIRMNLIDDRIFQDYMVGPLPINQETVIKPLTHVYNSGRSWTSMGIYGSDMNALQTWLDSISHEIHDIITGLFDSQKLQSDSEKPVFEVSSVDQPFVEHGHNLRWILFSQVSEAPTLLPQGLYFKADTTGRDPAHWKVVQWLYNDIVYATADDLREAIKSPSFVKLPGNIDGNWTRIEPEQGDCDHDYSHEAPPSFVQTGKSRILVDKEEGFVAWMGFTANLAFSQVNGLSLYDINLDGDRIIYELSLQEALAHYAGNDPIQSGTAFLDSFYGLGSGLSELVPGYDCPAYAHFLDTEYHRSEKMYRRSGTICIFEAPSDHPLQRHARKSQTTSFLNSVMIIRTIAVVGNYDYAIDYIFYLDGSVEVKARASGYIQGGYFINNQKYGFRVHDFLSSSIHDHVINFKVDFDIAASKNTMSVLTVAEEEIEYPWSVGLRQTMSLRKSQVSNEDDGSINWPANAASMYIITNQHAKNEYGQARGYRIMPGTGMGSPAHLTIKNSSVLQNSAKWAEHDFFVTKQKDSEPRSAAAENYLTPQDPLIDFAKFLDGENLVDEDL
jgi:primary-amine oxidase